MNPRKKLAIALVGVDFGCTKCFESSKKAHPHMPYRGEQRCCLGCAGDKGYLYEHFAAVNKKYPRRFGKKNGFWRKGIGCILAREDRSVTCQTFQCMLAHQNSPDTDKIEAARTQYNKDAFGGDS